MRIRYKSLSIKTVFSSVIFAMNPLPVTTV